MASFKDGVYGTILPHGESNTTFNNFLMDQTTDQMEWIFQARAAVTITRLGYRVNSGAGTTPNFKISLQGVDASGNPDGTIKGGASPASATFTPSTAANWYWATLDNSYTCARGERLAIVVAYNSGTIDGSNNVTFSSSFNMGPVSGYPYPIHNNAGTRARQANPPCYGYASATTAYGRPAKNIMGTSYSSNSTPDEYAVKFTVPTTVVSTYVVFGVNVFVITPAAAKTLKVFLYDGTTVIATATQDTDQFVAGGAIRPSMFLFEDTTLPVLSAGNTYRIGLQPQDTATNMQLLGVGLATAADLDAWPFGQDWAQSTRTDAGAWTDDATIRPIAELLIDDWTLATGGPVGHGRLTGGLQ